MPYALYGAGAVSLSFLGRLPHLHGRLGPVASSSYRVASRIVNSLRAGHAVKDCADLAACRVVLVWTPASALTAAVSRLAAARIEWASVTFLLCGEGPGSCALDPLRTQGAKAASLRPIEGAGARFVIEGDGPAVREARRLVRELRGKAVELPSSRVALYEAGVSFATSLFTPLIAAAVDALHRAGCNRATAAEIAELLFHTSLRGWAHAGRKSWTGPLAACGSAEARRHVRALLEHDPRVARYYAQAAAFALESLGRGRSPARNSTEEPFTPPG
jgi:predicted short-subunit dehydrogenase-like oxidoreductase (DUF2520 family)